MWRQAEKYPSSHFWHEAYAMRNLPTGACGSGKVRVRPTGLTASATMKR